MMRTAPLALPTSLLLLCVALAAGCSQSASNTAGTGTGGIGGGIDVGGINQNTDEDAGETPLEDGTDCAPDDPACGDAETATDAEETPDVEDAVEPEADASPTVSGPSCTTNGACKAYLNTPWCAVAINTCVECLFDGQCPAGSKCKGYSCQEFACQPGSQTCHDTISLDICGKDGKSVVTTSCPDNKPVCVKDQCSVCVPDKKYCGKPPAPGKPPTTVMQCNATGTAAKLVETCKDGNFCITGQCGVCQPGQSDCDGNKARTCKSDGSGFDIIDCGKMGQACQGGLCNDPCKGDPKAKTNVGCDYYAVDLDNAYVFSGTANDDGTPKYLDAQHAQFSVIVSNTSAATATVTVTSGTYKSSYSVAAGALKILNLPDPTWKACTAGKSCPFDQEGTNVNTATYRIKSTQPIVAYQFNPLQNYDVFSNDASLLLPTNGIGNEYWVMTREQTGDLRSYFTVVATSTAPTLVTVTSSCTTMAGACYQDKATNTVLPQGCAGGVQAMKKGDKQIFKLSQGQVLNLESAASGTDCTGTHIMADQPIVVFGGSESSNAPNTDHCVNGKCEFQGWACTTNADCPVTCCQDHLEEQLFAVSSWGTKYLATKFQPRGSEPDTWRILASVDGTTVTTTPPVATIPPLNAGQFYEFETKEDFLIESNTPILVGQFMHASDSPDPNNDTCESKFANMSSNICTQSWNKQGIPIACKKNADCPNIIQDTDAKIGDPDFSLLVPYQQYLSKYVFLVPTKYKENYINVVMPAGQTKATLDGQPLPASPTPKEFSPGWTIARYPITPGTHTLVCPPVGGLNCGLTVYGWDNFVSYSYPGGVQLTKP